MPVTGHVFSGRTLRADACASHRKCHGCCPQSYNAQNRPPTLKTCPPQNERSPGFLPCGHRQVPSPLAGVPGSYLPGYWADLWRACCMACAVFWLAPGANVSGCGWRDRHILSFSPSSCSGFRQGFLHYERLLVASGEKRRALSCFTAGSATRRRAWVG